MHREEGGAKLVGFSFLFYMSVLRYVFALEQAASLASMQCAPATHLLMPRPHRRGRGKAVSGGMSLQNTSPTTTAVNAPLLLCSRHNWGDVCLSHSPPPPAFQEKRIIHQSDGIFIAFLSIIPLAII